MHVRINLHLVKATRSDQPCTVPCSTFPLRTYYRSGMGTSITPGRAQYADCHLHYRMGKKRVPANQDAAPSLATREDSFCILIDCPSSSLTPSPRPSNTPENQINACLTYWRRVAEWREPVCLAGCSECFQALKLPSCCTSSRRFPYSHENSRSALLPMVRPETDLEWMFTARH